MTGIQSLHTEVELYSTNMIKLFKTDISLKRETSFSQFYYSQYMCVHDTRRNKP